MDNEIVVYEETYRLAEKLATSALIPDRFKRPQDAWYALLRGKELGMSPIFSLENIAVIKGRTSLSADAMFALARSNPEYGGCTIVDTNEACTITMKRISPRGFTDERTFTFTMEDAKTAGLLGNETYRKYPKRMLKHRCMAYICRDLFGDALANMYTPEELESGVDGVMPATYEMVGDEVRTPVEDAKYTKQEILNMVKQAKELMQSFSLVYSTKEKYDIRIATATKTPDGDSMQSILAELRTRKEQAEKQSHKQEPKEEPIETEFTPVEQPETVEVAVEIPEAPEAPEQAEESPVSQLKVDAINAMSSLLASSPNYEIKHGCASVKKQLGITFEGTDWQAAIINTPLPDGILLKAIAYWEEAKSKVKPSRTEAKPDYKTMCMDEFAKFPECRIKNEMQQSIDAAEGQTSDSEGWKILYEQAVEFLPEAIKEANNE